MSCCWITKVWICGSWIITVSICSIIGSSTICSISCVGSKLETVESTWVGSSKYSIV